MKQFQKDTGGTLLNGLTSFWKLKDATDFWGTNNLTQNGTISYTTGPADGAVELGTSNTGNYLSFSGLLANAPSPINGGAYTVSFWVYLETGNAANVMFFNWADMSTANHMGLTTVQMPSGNGGLATDHIDSSGNYQSTTASFTFTTGTWYLLTLTYDGSTQKLYINGSSTPTITLSAANTGTNAVFDGNSTAFNIGAYRSGSLRCFSGRLADFGIWNRVLSSTEISDLYNAGGGNTLVSTGTWSGVSGKGRIGRFFSTDPTMVGYYQFEGAAQDNGGGGSTITVNGTVAQRGRIGRSIQNTASGDYVTVANTSLLSTSIANSNQITILFWVMFPSSPGSGGFPIMCHGRDNAATCGYQVGWNYFVASAMAWSMTYGGSTQASCGESPTFTPSGGIWYLYACTWDGSTMKIYRNGQLTGTNAVGAQTITPQTYDLDFFNRRNTTGTYQGGTAPFNLQEVAIFSRAMSAQQIAQYYAWAMKKKMNFWQRFANAFNAFTKTVSVSMMNSASRLATIARRFSGARTASIAQMEGASRTQTIGRQLTLVRKVAIGMMYAASRVVSFIAKFPLWSFRSKHNTSWTARGNHPATWAARAKHSSSWTARARSSPSNTQTTPSTPN